MSQYDWRQGFGNQSETEIRHNAEDFYRNYNNNTQSTYYPRSSSSGSNFGLIGALIGLAFKIVFWAIRLIFGIKKKR